MTICEGLATGFAIVSATGFTYWCTEAVPGAERYEWDVMENGVVEQGPITAEPVAEIISHFAEALSTRVRACDALACSAPSEWSGAEVLPLDATGDGIVGGPDYFALRRLGGLTGFQFNVLRRGFGRLVGWYP